MKRVTRISVWLSGILLASCQAERSVPDGSGTIECTQVEVAPQVGGRLLQLPPQEGAAVQRGDLVAQIDPTDYALKRDEARTAFGLAQAELDLVLAGSREEDIARAREQVREAQALTAAALADRQRIQQLFEQGDATPKQKDDAQAAADRTAAALAAAEQNLARLVKGSRPEEIRIARAKVELAQIQLAQAEKALADCTVTAPMDGVVTTRIREAGEVVNAGAALLTLSRLDEVWLSVYVPETRIGRITLGQTARVKVDGQDQFFSGKVTFISPQAEFTPKNVQTPDQRAKLVYRVKVTLPNPEGIFKPGMPADGYLSGQSKL